MSDMPTKTTATFYPAVYGGKYHVRKNPVQAVALCRGTIEVDLTAGPIVRGPLDTSRPHPMLCRRCLAATGHLA